MKELAWIVGSGVLMSAIALVGGVALILREDVLKRIILPLVAFSAGSLVGGAFFHMLPSGVASMGNDVAVYAWFVAGFSLFLVLEQFLNWHHCHRTPSEHREHAAPLNTMVLIADGLHNLIGGVAVGGIFMIDIRLGIAAWLAAAAHEVPQELGDFGILVYGGWSRRKALVFNVASALTFLIGGVLAWAASFRLDISFLLPFAAGNFVYIAAADLIPEIKRDARLGVNLLHFTSFAAGVLLLLGLRLAFEA